MTRGGSASSARHCARARQNVLFEGGYLTALFRPSQPICLLQFGDLEIPSDLNGLLIERFDGPIDPERLQALGPAQA